MGESDGDAESYQVSGPRFLLQCEGNRRSPRAQRRDLELTGNERVACSCRRDFPLPLPGCAFHPSTPGGGRTTEVEKDKNSLDKGPTLPEATRGSSTLTLLASPGKRPPRWTSALGTRYTPNPHFRHIPSRLCPGRRDRVARRSTAPRSPRNMLRDCHRCLHRNGDVTHRRRAITNTRERDMLVPDEDMLVPTAVGE